jgi:hypothetical protein
MAFPIRKILPIILIILSFLNISANTFIDQYSLTQNSNPIVTFKENLGQVSDQFYKPRPDVLFSGTDGQMNFHLKKNGISYQLCRIDSWQQQPGIYSHTFKKIKKTPDQTTIYRIEVGWLGSNQNCFIEKDKVLPGYDNYYLEVCPNGIHNVKTYGEITYKNIYTNIDLRYYSKNGQLEYDFIVKAGADYKQIEIEIRGATGIKISKSGELVIETPLGEIIEKAPVAIQGNKQLKSGWKINSDVVSFEIKNVNPALPLLIDPAIRSWGTYYGGPGGDQPYSCSVDKNKNVYFCGFTNSTTLIATSGAYQSVYAGSSDAYLAKFNPGGTRLWATYYGGNQNECSYGCQTTLSGFIYLVGTTTSTTTASVIATPGSHQPNSGGGPDAFAVKFNSSGVRIWGTYYGGSAQDIGTSCCVDTLDNLYMVGSTYSVGGSGIATPGSHQPVFGGGPTDDFIVKFDKNCVRQWGSYYGGPGSEIFSPSCSSDGLNNIYLCGTTQSTIGIATPGSFQPFSATGGGYFVRFNNAGTRLWGTYYGSSSGGTSAVSCSTDNFGKIYFAGTTNDTTANVIATPGSHQPKMIIGGLDDSFLVKFDSSGGRQWGTYYGGYALETGNGCATDSLGNVYLCGTTESDTGFIAIATPGSHQPFYGGNANAPGDGFLAKFDKNGVRQWGTFYGGDDTEYGNSCVSDNAGRTYLCGLASSTLAGVISTPGSCQPFFGNQYFVQFIDCPVIPVSITPTSTILCRGQTATLTANGTSTYSWSTGVTNASVVVTPSVTTNYTVNGIQPGGCYGSKTVSIMVISNPTIGVSISNSSLCLGETATLTASGASTYTWNTGSNNAVISISPVNTVTYSVSGSVTNGCSGTKTFTINVSPNPTLSISTSNTLICSGDSSILMVTGANSYSWSTGTTGNSAIISPTLTTSYTVTGTNNNGCSTMSVITQNVSSCIGIKEFFIESIYFLIYPNPNNGNLSIETDRELHVVLVNELGQTVQNITLNEQNNFKASVTNLIPGVYIVTSQEARLNKKVVVIK